MVVDSICLFTNNVKARKESGEDIRIALVEEMSKDNSEANGLVATRSVSDLIDFLIIAGHGKSKYSLSIAVSERDIICDYIALIIASIPISKETAERDLKEKSWQPDLFMEEFSKWYSISRTPTGNVASSMSEPIGLNCTVFLNLLNHSVLY